MSKKNEALSLQKLKATYKILKYNVKINPTKFYIYNLNATKKEIKLS